MRNEFFFVILIVLFGAACQQSQPIAIVEESPTLFSDEDINEAILQVSDEVEIIPVVVDGVISDGEVITTDSNGEEDSLNTLLNVNSLSGYVCNIINNTNGRNKWRIQSLNIADESVIGLVGVKQDGRAIQSIGCTAQGNRAAFSMKTSASADYEVFLIDYTGATRQVFQLTNNGKNDIDVSMSADGNTIAWQSWIGSDKVITVRKYASDGSFSDTILDGAVPYVEPSVNSDGTYVAFIDIQSNQTNLLKHNLNNGSTVAAYTTSGKRSLAHPSISNDGQRVAWMDGADDENLKVKDLTSNMITEIITNNPNLEHGFLADDGMSVVYSINRDDKAFTKVKNVDDGTTANVGRVLQQPARYRGSSWVKYQAPSLYLGWTPSAAIYDEGDGSKTLTITRSGNLTSALVVTLTSDDSSEVTVQSSITIPSGSSQATVTIMVQPDELASDGDQTAVLTATASGYASDTTMITVKDITTPPSEETQLFLSNGELIFTDINALSSERLKLSLQTINSVDYIRFEERNGLSMDIAGSDASNIVSISLGARVPLSLVDSIFIDTKADLTTSDEVLFLLSMNLPKGLTILSKEISLSPNTNESTITVDSENSQIRLEGKQDVRVSNTRLLTDAGNITLVGNIDTIGSCGMAVGNFKGLVISNASTIRTLSGSIDMSACGGTSGNGNYGISMGEGSLVRTTLGAIDLKGIGGNSLNGEKNHGISVFKAIVESLGTGEVNVQASAGSGTRENFGLQITGTETLNGAYIGSVDGDINISGFGGKNASDVSNVGVRMTRSAAIKSTGSAKITVYGEGGTGSCSYDFNLSRAANLCNYYGIDILWGSEILSSGSGEIHIEGRAGTAYGRGHHGVHLAPGNDDKPTGKIVSHNADIYVTGHGGTDTSSNVTSCAIPAEQRTDSCFDGFSGIYLTHGGLIEAKNSANIYITGNGGTGGTRTHGLFFEGEEGVSTSKILAENGNIVIVGNAGQNTFSGKSNGVNMLMGVISISGTGNVDIKGIGGSGVVETHGLQMNREVTKIQTTSGAIVISGKAGIGTGNSHVGVNMVNGAQILSGSGDIDIEGTGGRHAVSANFGLSVYSTVDNPHSSRIQSDSGNMKIYGQAGGNGNGDSNIGVRLKASSVANTGGKIISNTGLIEITALGGIGTNDNNGLRLESGASTIQTNANITINATASPMTTGIRNRGVILIDDAIISSSANGDLLINAVGGGGASSNDGISILSDSKIYTTLGKIEINAQAGNNGIDLVMLDEDNERVSGLDNSIGSDTTSGAIKLTADTMLVAQGLIQSSGNLIIQPRSPYQDIILGGVDDDVSLHLGDSELAILKDGFAKIVIGDVITGTGDIIFEGAEFSDSVTVSGDLIVGIGAKPDVNMVNNDEIVFDGVLTPGKKSTSIAPTLGDFEVSGRAKFTPDSIIRLNLEDESVSTINYDRLEFNSNLVKLNNVKLELIASDSFTPLAGESFIISKNDGNESYSGTFLGLPEGSNITTSTGLSGTISYQGGDGNDIAITILDGESAETQLSFSSGHLSFVDINSPTTEKVKMFLQTVNGVDFITVEDLNDNLIEILGPDIISLPESEGRFGGRIPLSLVESIFVDTAADLVTNDEVLVLLSMDLPNGLTILSKEVSLSPNTDESTITVDADSSQIRLEGKQAVRVSDAILLTDSGNITVLGNADANGSCGAASGSFKGLVISNASTIRTLSGSIDMSACGGTSGNDNYGISMGEGSLVDTTSGLISLKGNGGTGTGNGQIGVNLVNGAQIASDTGEIDVTGIGGMNSTSANYGVSIYSTVNSQNTSKIQSQSGNIKIYGKAGGNGSGSSNVGVRLKASSIPNTGGKILSNTGTIEVSALGGKGTNDNNGLRLESGVSKIETNGNITINAIASSTASGVRNRGMILIDDAVIDSLSNGDVSITAIGGGGTSSNDGISILSDSKIYSISGKTEVTAQAGGNGVDLVMLDEVTGQSNSIGTATSSGAIKLFANTMLIAQGLVQSSGNLTIQPRSPSQKIILGGSDDGSSLHLGDSELAILKDGFAKIIVGDVNSGTGDIIFDSAEFSDATTVSGGLIVGIGAKPDVNMTSNDEIVFDGTLNPGKKSTASVPILSKFEVSGKVKFTPESVITLNLEDESVSTINYDRLEFNSSPVKLNNAKLELIASNSFTPLAGESFVIGKNDSSENYFGTFLGLLEGSNVTTSTGLSGIISYQGGDGNDISIHF